MCKRTFGADNRFCIFDVVIVLLPRVGASRKPEKSRERLAKRGFRHST
jgi:hypothetical protein